MTQKYPNGEKIISPGTVIVSAGGEVSDVKKVVSPVLVMMKRALSTILISVLTSYVWEVLLLHNH